MSRSPQSKSKSSIDARLRPFLDFIAQQLVADLLEQRTRKDDHHAAPNHATKLRLTNSLSCCCQINRSKHLDPVRRQSLPRGR